MKNKKPRKKMKVKAKKKGKCKDCKDCCCGDSGRGQTRSIVLTRKVNKG